MSAPDAGVDRLFHQATEHVYVDVDRLVAGGLDRGRARRRHHLAGTAVAVAATIGVIGAGAGLAPQLGPDGAGHLRVATGGATATPPPSPTPSQSPSASPTPTPTPATSHLSEPGPPTVAAGEIPRRVAQLVPGHEVGEPLMQAPYGVADAEEEKIVHFHVDGMLTTLIISPARASLAYDCADESTVACRTLADGTLVQVAEPTTADQVTMQDVIAIGQTWMVDVMSYNAADGKNVTPIQAEPALSEQELITLASSDSWFE